MRSAIPRAVLEAGRRGDTGALSRMGRAGAVASIAARRLKRDREDELRLRAEAEAEEMALARGDIDLQEGTRFDYTE